MSNVHSFEKQGPKRTRQQERTTRHPDGSINLPLNSSSFLDKNLVAIRSNPYNNYEI